MLKFKIELNVQWENLCYKNMLNKINKTKIIMSSDSENSDYVVEEYIKPLVIRNTYDKKDLISDGEHDSDSNSDEEDDDEETEENTETNGEGKVAEQCKIPVQDEPAKANSRYILYVTNLSSETTREKLMDLFFDCGKVKGIRVPKVRLGKFAFVEMADEAGFNVIFNTVYCYFHLLILVFNLLEWSQTYKH